MRSSPLLPILLAIPALACSPGSEAPAAEGRGGEEVYGVYCAACHGKDGRGTRLNLGPSFAGVREHWDTDRLLEYVADPQAFAANDPRLGKRQMTALPDKVPAGERERLAEYALGLMD